MWGWVDEGTALEDSPDRGEGRHIRDAGVGVQMGGDGIGAGVQTAFGQGLAQPHDALFDFGGDGLRAVCGHRERAR